MTTESKPHPTTVGTRALLRSTGVLMRAGGLALGVVVALAAVAALVTGSTGAAGVLTGGLVALAVFLGGSFAVSTVASVSPSLSLIFALLTYALQLLVVGLFFSAVSRSGLLDTTLDASWISAAIIVVTVIWLGAQIALFARARILVYDLPSQAGER